MRDDRYNDVTPLTDDAAAGEVHLEATPVAGEEVWRQDEHGETTLVDTLADYLFKYAAWQEVAMVYDGRYTITIQVIEQVVTHPAAVI